MTVPIESLDDALGPPGWVLRWPAWPSRTIRDLVRSPPGDRTGITVPSSQSQRPSRLLWASAACSSWPDRDDAPSTDRPAVSEVPSTAGDMAPTTEPVRVESTVPMTTPAFGVDDVEGVPAIPPEFFDDREAVDDGQRIYVDEAIEPTTAFVVSPGSTRVISLGPYRNDPSPSFDSDRWLAAVAELANYADDTPLSALRATERFVPLATAASGRVSTAYRPIGTESEGVQVTVVSVADRLTEREFAQLAEQFGGTDNIASNARAEELRESGQREYVEQISPTDVLAILGPADASDDSISAWINGLRFVPKSDLGVEIQDFATPVSGERVTQGEQRWGRWQITEQVADGERCLSFGAAVGRVSKRRWAARRSDADSSATSEIFSATRSTRPPTPFGTPAAWMRRWTSTSSSTSDARPSISITSYTSGVRTPSRRAASLNLASTSAQCCGVVASAP